ncbi:MAG: hypothetical protein CL674_14600 [Bdellovibrionaceae bacterium]|jgi:integrase|nr:hypothetical protein [Pseudobdellovibrionaceae bacterium]MAF92497.1 hypothetical protein [Pseudobdellovibrionaceae bacterium]QDP47589.1 MAG: putative integrase [Prokaryotic dsDNA virus sp.]|tara:strand:+ start:32127 stop:33284 length:1158 start_codon:yes stop_codon:yes gene_type:complete
MKRYSEKKYPNIYVKENGTLYLLKSINNVRVKRSLGTTKIREALEKAEEIENEIRKEFNRSDFHRAERKKKGIHNPSIKELWEEFKNYKYPRVGPGSHRIYENAWNNHLSHFWDGLHLKDFTPLTVGKWENWYIKNRKKTTYFNQRKALVTFSRYLLKNGYITGEGLEFEDLDKTALNSAKRHRKKLTYTRREIEKIYETESAFYGLIYRIAITTGARKSEIYKLKLNQIKKIDGVMHINFWSFKNKKFRLVMIQPDIEKEIVSRVKLAKEKKTEYLFFRKTKPSDHIAPQLIDKHFLNIKRNVLKLPDGKKVFHDLRRTFASMTAEQGWPPLVACDILDMSLEIYQKVYCKISEEVKTEKLKKLALDQFKKESVEIQDLEVDDV